MKGLSPPCFKRTPPNFQGSAAPGEAPHGLASAPSVTVKVHGRGFAGPGKRESSTHPSIRARPVLRAHAKAARPAATAVSKFQFAYVGSATG